MSDKQMVVEALQRLPDSVSLEEIQEELACLLAAIRCGRDAAAARRVIEHEENSPEVGRMDYGIVWTEPAAIDLERILAHLAMHSPAGSRDGPNGHFGTRRAALAVSRRSDPFTSGIAAAERGKLSIAVIGSSIKSMNRNSGLRS